MCDIVFGKSRRFFCRYCFGYQSGVFISIIDNPTFECCIKHIEELFEVLKKLENQNDYQLGKKHFNETLSVQKGKRIERNCFYCNRRIKYSLIKSILGFNSVYNIKFNTNMYLHIRCIPKLREKIEKRFKEEKEAILTKGL